MEISLSATLLASTMRCNLCEILNVRRDLIYVSKLYQYFYLYICGNNVLIDWLIIKVRDLHVPHAQQMVFRPDVIKKLTKQMETKMLLIYVWESKKSFLIFLFIKLILMFLWKKKRLWKLGQLIYEHFFFNISTTIIIHNIYRYIYIYYMLEVKKKKT